MSSSRLARLVRAVPRVLSSARSGRPNVAMSMMPRAFHASPLARCEAAAETKPTAEITSPKVQEIYDQVLQMNLLETIELVNALKDKFGYVEVAAVAAAPAAAGGGEAAPAQEEEVVEKTEFTVRLDKFGASDKIKVIKEVRTITGLGLKQAKDLVESAPDAIIKKDCPKEEAEELVEKLKAIGGECVLE